MPDPQFEVVSADEPQFSVEDAGPATLRQRRGGFSGTMPAPTGTISAYHPSNFDKLKAAVPAVGHVADILSGNKPFNAPMAAKDTTQLAYPERVYSEEEQAQHPIRTGVDQFAGSMTSPENMLLMAGTGALGAVPGTLGRALPRVVSGAFSIDMLHQAAQQVPAIKAALDRGDVGEAKRQATLAGLTGAMGAAAGIHTATSVVDPRLSIDSSPDATRVGATVAGGRAGAGIQVTPDAVTVGGKIGPFQGSKTFSRGQGSTPNGLEPPTIQGNPQPIQPDASAQAISDYDQVMANAGKIVRGEPIAPPPPPKPVVPNIGSEQIQEIGGMLEKIPEAQRAQAIIETHGTLAKLLLQQGKIVANGKLEVIKTPEQADSVAQRLINDEVQRRDKEAEQAAKEAAKPAPKVEQAKPVAKVSSRQKAEELNTPKFEVKEAEPKFEVVPAQGARVESNNGKEANVGEIGSGKGVTVSATAEPTSQQQPTITSQSNTEATAIPSERPSPAANGLASTTESTQFSKGDAVTFSRNMQVAKGEGKSEIIRVGTKGSVEHFNPALNFARVRLEDGKVQTVPLRYLESGHGEQSTVPVSVEPNGSQGAVVPSAGAGSKEQLPGGVSEGRPQGSDQPQRNKESTLAPGEVPADQKPLVGQTSNIEKFKTVYARHLARAIDLDPKTYAYGKDKIPDVVKRMTDSLTRGAASKDSPAIRATLKELGIKDTFTAIRQYLTAPMPAEPPQASSAQEPTGAVGLANAVHAKLKAGESLGNVTDLNAMAEKHFGSARTSGEWTPKDAFDAMEAGVNKHLLDRGKDLMAMDAHKGLAELRDLMGKITSQGTRTEDQIKNQQFSTPPTESYVAAKVANLKPSDVVLDPSAGNGGLAVWPQSIGAETHVNEIAPRRQEMLKAVGFDKPTAHDGEIINSLLDQKVKPTVILMNPPFSASTQKSFEAKNRSQYGFNHVDSALQRLEPNGRLVAILGGGQANEPNGGASLTAGGAGKWFEKIADKYNVRANIRINGKEYQKYGTNFATRLIVIDKDGPTPSRVAAGAVKSWDSVVQKNVDTLEEAYNALRQVAESRPEVSSESGQGKLANQPGTSLEPSGSAGSASDRTPVRGSGETQAGNELSSRPDGSVRSPSGNEAIAGDRGTAVRQPEVQPTEHPETKASGSPEVSSANANAERPLSGTETGDAGLSLGRDKSLPVKEEEDSAAYVAYHPVLKGPTHPANIVETRTMATVPLPEITYKPSLPESVLKDGKLSSVQLEAISIAGQQNDIILPGGARATALIGDGTGVGKGRIGAGVLWDNWRKGRKRLVWVSEKWDLMQDAIRDLKGIGADDLAKTIKPFGKISASTPVDHEGILFSTYALIRSEDKNGNSRVNQLQEWLKGKDSAEGAYILYDESHNLKNAVAANAQQVSQIGAAVKKLMADNPKLRSVSLSATAATDVINLGYLDRLGLWGAGTPFPNGFGEFQAQIASGGMSAMEMVARELKAQGKYVSRTLSYKGVTYEEVEHVLSEEQKDLYRTASKAWASVVQQAEDTIKNTTNGGAQAKARFMSLFYGAQLRFFNVLLTTLKIPTAVEQANKALADGKSVVITLVNTNEAAQNREKNRDRGGEDSDEVPDYDFGPGEMLKDLVREHYPIQQFVDDVDSEGNPIKVPAYQKDADGRDIPLINPQAAKERDQLIAQLDRDLKMPANPLDILINSLGGPKKVAELTGRKERYDEDSGKFVPRGDPNVKRDEINLSEMRGFQGGKKRVAILSSAAGTGISLHAGNDAVNQQKRVHITLQPGWSADKAMQMMGRTHRSNEASQPEYKMLTSDLGGEKRFTSTLAKRMGSLGALSKGQSNANAGADMMEKVNFESDQGRQATTSFYNAMLRDVKIPGTKLTGMQVLTDLRVLKRAPGGGGMTVPPADRTNVTRLLNRLLALDPDVQSSVYNYFYDIFQATVQQAVEDGTLDTGVKTLPGDDFSVKEERSISKDPKTGAETYYYPVDANVRTNRMTVNALDKALKANAKKNAVIMRNKEGKVSLVMDASPIVHASGSVTPASSVVSPENGNAKKVATNSLYNWQPVAEWAAKAHADAESALENAKSSLEYSKRTAERYAGQDWATSKVQRDEQAIKDAESKLADVKGAAEDTPQWARDQWEKQYAEAPAHTTKDHHLIGGAVLRWWNPIREASSQALKIYTAVDSKTGKRVVGVDIPADEIRGLLQRITGGSSTVDAGQLHTDVLKNGLNYTLEQGIQVKRGRVNRQSVVQFIPPNPNIANTLKGMGLIYERGVQPIYYLPNAEGRQEKDRVEGILDKILKEYPVKQEPSKGDVEKPESRSEAGFATPEMLIPEKLLNAGEKVFEAAANAYEHLTAPPKWDGIQELTRRWTGAENANAWELSQFTKEIKEAVPSKLKREALSNWIEAGGDDATLKRWADRSKLAYKKGYDAALDLTPEEQDVGRGIINLHNSILKKAQAAGIVDQGIENYVQHIWDKDPGAARKIISQINFAGLQPNPAFAKQRKIPTYFDGEKLGFTPKDKDVGFLTAAHIQAFNKAIASREYIQSLFAGKAEDGRPLATIAKASAVEIPGDGQDDYGAYLIKPNMKAGQNYLDYQPFDHPALRKWRWADTNPDTQKPVFVQGDAYLHPDIYDHVKNNLSRSALQAWTVKALGSEFRPGRLLLNASSEIKHVILSLSGFHQLTVTERAAEHGVFKREPLNLEDTDQRFAVDHGLMVADFHAMQEFSEGVASGGIITKIPGIGTAYDSYLTHLFKTVIPELKMATFRKELARNQKRYADLSEDQAGMLTADQVNETFGGLNYKALGRNPTLQDVLRLGLLAPDFLESSTKSEVKAALPYGRSHLRAILVGAVALYTLARLLNEMSDGQPHWDKPLSVVYKGKEYSIRTRATDLMRAVADPQSFLYGRLNPMARTAVEEIAGYDAQGHKTNLAGEAGEGVHELKEGAKDVAGGNVGSGLSTMARGVGKATGQNIPIPLQPFTSDRGDQSTADKITESLLKLVGVNVKNFHSPVEEEAYKISKEHGSSREFTPEQREKYYEHQRVIDGLRKGDSKPLEEALEKGAIAPREIRSYMMRAAGSPLYDKVHSFSFEEAQRVYDKAVEEKDEKAQEELLPLVMEKWKHEMQRGHYEEAPVQ
jgi:hypothetical protein